MPYQAYHAICKPLKSLPQKTVPSYYQAYHAICKSLKTNGATSFQPCCPNPPIPPYRWEGHLGSARPLHGKGLRNLFVVTADTSLAEGSCGRGSFRPQSPWKRAIASQCAPCGGTLRYEHVITNQRTVLINFY